MLMQPRIKILFFLILQATLISSLDLVFFPSGSCKTLDEGNVLVMSLPACAPEEKKKKSNDEVEVLLR